MNLHYPRTYRIVLLLSVLIAGLWVAIGGSELEIGIFVVLMISTGIPHGATDHVIDRFHKAQQGSPFSWGKFLTTYLGAMGLYGVAWYVFPLLSLTIFILISAYHFGQSQLMFIRTGENDLLKQLAYLCWGLLILGGIIGFHPVASGEILAVLLDQHLITSWQQYVYVVMVGSGGVLTLILWRFWQKGFLNTRELAIEAGHIVFLLGLAYSTSLLISFSIYFGLWHSLSSISHEIQIFKEANADFRWKNFVQYALPFSLMSFVGIGLLIWGGQMLSAVISPYLLFFIAISTLTLPHMVFMQGFYQVRAKQSRTAVVG